MSQPWWDAQQVLNRLRLRMLRNRSLQDVRTRLTQPEIQEILQTGLEQCAHAPTLMAAMEQAEEWFNEQGVLRAHEHWFWIALWGQIKPFLDEARHPSTMSLPQHPATPPTTGSQAHPPAASRSHNNLPSASRSHNNLPSASHSHTSQPRASRSFASLRAAAPTPGTPRSPSSPRPPPSSSPRPPQSSSPRPPQSSSPRPPHPSSTQEPAARTTQEAPPPQRPLRSRHNLRRLSQSSLRAPQGSDEQALPKRVLRESQSSLSAASPTSDPAIPEREAAPSAPEREAAPSAPEREAAPSAPEREVAPSAPQRASSPPPATASPEGPHHTGPSGTYWAPTSKQEAASDSLDDLPFSTWWDTDALINSLKLRLERRTNATQLNLLINHPEFYEGLTQTLEQASMISDLKQAQAHVVQWLQHLQTLTPDTKWVDAFWEVLQPLLQLRQRFSGSFDAVPIPQVALAGQPSAKGKDHPTPAPSNQPEEQLWDWEDNNSEWRSFINGVVGKIAHKDDD